jgi:hypothetical protein
LDLDYGYWRSIVGGVTWAQWDAGVWPGVFIEAEHHMVLNSNGSLIDVTPPPDPLDATVVFLPDPNTPFDFSTRRIITNKNRTLAYEPQSRVFLDLAARQKAMHGDTFGVSREVDLGEYRRLGIASLMAKDALLKKIRVGLGRSDPCLCGSGSKYKRCHGA